MPTQSRRKFIQDISFATVFLASGKVGRLSAAEVGALQKKVTMRFAVASDVHYGQPNTPFDEMMEKMTSQVNLFHKANTLDFCVINGDLIHNEKSLLERVKTKADALKMPYYVTRGNHDMVTAEHWKQVWDMPLNHETVVKQNAIILGDTSDEKGTYLPPDLAWLKSTFEKHKSRKHIFLFIHIPQAKWTANGIDTPAFFELVDKYPNIKAVFHGHEHDQDGVKMHGKIPYFFDSHVGGNWGTDYKGFRVVELMEDDSIVTYMMNPGEKMNEQTY